MQVVATNKERILTGAEFVHYGPTMVDLLYARSPDFSPRRKADYPCSHFSKEKWNHGSLYVPMYYIVAGCGFRVVVFVGAEENSKV